MGKVLAKFKVSVKKKMFASVEYTKKGDLQRGKIVFSESPQEGTVDMLQGTEKDPAVYYMKLQTTTVAEGKEVCTVFFDEEFTPGALSSLDPDDPICFAFCPPFAIQCPSGVPDCDNNNQLKCD